MNCNFTRAKDLLTPGTTLTLGTITSQSTDVDIYCRRTSNGAIYKEPTESEADGTVKLTLSDNASYFHPSADYEIWVVLRDGNIADNETITVDAVEYDGFVVAFKRKYNRSNILTSAAAQSITV